MACAIEGCGAPVSCKNWCLKHYTRWRRHGNPLTVHRDWRPAIEKVWDQLRVDEASGCWLWTGTVDVSGYVVVCDTGKRRVLGHRLVWEYLCGAIPDGLELDHLCFTRNCLNVEHLDPVTPAENKRRMQEHVMSVKTHCPQGHPYAGENLRREKDGHRRCQTCREAQSAARNERRRVVAL